jgi:ADP-ribose pyrophosphatase
MLTSEIIVRSGRTSSDFQIRSLWKIKKSMKREYPECPLVGVGAVIAEKDRVVLVKRGRAPLLGEWSIPGGLLEVGETLRRGAEREALEETGLVVRATELLGVFERIVPDDDKRLRYHYVLIDFLCERISGELKASGDAAEARWFLRDELNGLPLPEDTAEVIRLGIVKADQLSSKDI